MSPDNVNVVLFGGEKKKKIQSKRTAQRAFVIHLNSNVYASNVYVYDGLLTVHASLRPSMHNYNGIPVKTQVLSARKGTLGLRTNLLSVYICLYSYMARSEVSTNKN